LTLQQARNAGEKLYLDDCIRGVPPGTDAFDADEIAERKWRPIDGRMALPVLTLDEAAFANNRALMLRYISEQGVAIAPHAKTPMAPALALALIEGGAWGATVADIRQAGVMLRAGVSRLILANEVGGIGGARRLATLLAKWPNAEFAVFVDSRAAVDALAAVWRADGALAPLRVLVELGAGRAGARTYEAAAEIVAAISEAGGRLALAGVAAYEGAAAQPTPQATQTAIAGLLALTGDVLRLVRAQVGRETPLILTAGGSVFFEIRAEDSASAAPPFRREARFAPRCGYGPKCSRGQSLTSPFLALACATPPSIKGCRFRCAPIAMARRWPRRPKARRSSSSTISMRF
jgi:D-serine dehydratase